MSEIEYSDLLFEISEKLDGNKLPRLVFMCRNKIAKGREENIQDVLTLFKELEQHHSLGIDRLDTLKEILTQMKKRPLLKKVEEFEIKRKAQSVGIVSSLKRAAASIKGVVTGNACPQQQQVPSQGEVPIRIVLLYKDQKAANSVRRQLSDLSRKINTEIRPVYTSRKIKDTIKVKEQKPPIVNQQSAVYYYKCDLCDADYVGYSCRHLHQRIEEHKGSSIGHHVKEQHGKEPHNIEKNFKILRGRLS
ncbi:hypothetical protein ACROYT_G036218 [Oculina patagonica]